MLSIFAFAKRVIANDDKPEKGRLFDGDDDMFIRLVGEAKDYGEFGSGKSTIWVAANTTANITSVDSSEEWIENVKQEIGVRKVNFKWVDCGKLANWGVPLGFEKRENFLGYAHKIWEDGTEFDHILIDGRFRVLCFLVALRNAKEGTRLIFDDYVDRPHYHIVEEFVNRDEVCGRQCLFIVPPKDKLDSANLDFLISKFEYLWS